MWFELHCHSTCSDGTEAPAEVARRAAARGVAVFALTDHDTTEGVAHVEGARNLRATELTCEADGRTIHVLVYDRGRGGWDAIEALLATMRATRRDRLIAMAARLGERGVRIDVEPLLASGRAVGRPDLARAMVAVGAAATPREAFARHLFDGGPVDVPHRAPSIALALAAGRAAGAAMALAHPHFYDPHDGPNLARRYRDDGLTGIEAFYGTYDAAQRRRWIALADELGLVCTGGSDWHGPEKDGAAMNSTSNTPIGIDIPSRRTDALLRWLDA